MRPDSHAHLGGDRLDPRGGVDRVSGEEPLSRSGGDPEAHECLPRVDPDAELEGRSADEVEFFGVLADPQTRPHGTLWVVLVSGGDPEDPDDGIADELLHHPAVGLDLLPAIAK